MKNGRFVYDGIIRYYKDNQQHRENGPAIEYPDGTKFWYLHNKRIDCKTQEEFEQLMKLKAFW